MTGPSASLPVLVMRWPDGREITANLTHEPDLQDEARFMWACYMALLQITRQATDKPDGPLDLDTVLGVLKRCEYQQRYLTGCYRGLLEQANGLLKDLGAAVDDKMLKELHRQENQAKEQVSQLFKRFRDLMLHGLDGHIGPSRKTDHG